MNKINIFVCEVEVGVQQKRYGNQCWEEAEFGQWWEFFFCLDVPSGVESTTTPKTNFGWFIQIQAVYCYYSFPL